MYNGVTTQHIQKESKISHYTHLTIDDREKVRIIIERGKSIRAIALELNRSPSTVSREFKRNLYANGTYAAHHAEKMYRKRRKNCGKTPLLSEGAAREYVLEKLELRWSPEQISEQAKLDKEPFSFSYPTIYRSIDSEVLPRQLKKLMCFKWKNKKSQDKDNRGKIPDTVSIHDRPAEIENRTVIGHRESDTVLGKRETGCFGTHVERKTGVLIAFRIDGRQDDAFNKATIKAFKPLPDDLKKSFTVDNGKEFSAHKELAAATGMSVYFCDPYSPWQRGTNENTNGLLRQFFPKGTSFADISDDDLQHVVDLINNRPIKRFGFRTPYKVLRLCCT